MTRIATKQDVQDAARIGEVMGNCDLLGLLPRCISRCDHLSEDHCVGDAIGASQQAADLWLSANTAYTSPDDMEEIKEDGIPGDISRAAARNVWFERVTGIVEFDAHPYGAIELAVAKALRNGHLPPGWEISDDNVVSRSNHGSDVAKWIDRFRTDLLFESIKELLLEDEELLSNIEDEEQLICVEVAAHRLLRYVELAQKRLRR